MKCLGGLNLKVSNPDETQVWHIQSLDDKDKAIVNLNLDRTDEHYKNFFTALSHVIINYDNAFFNVGYSSEKSGFIKGFGWIPTIHFEEYSRSYLEGSYFKIGNQVFSNPHNFELKKGEPSYIVTSFWASGKKWQYNEETKNWEAD